MVKITLSKKEKDYLYNRGWTWIQIRKLIEIQEESTLNDLFNINIDMKTYYKLNH